MSIQTTSPVTNQRVNCFDDTIEKGIDRAVDQATEAFSSWKKNTYDVRANLLHQIAAQMRTKKELLANLITQERGTPIDQVKGEIILSADILDYYATHTAIFLADKLFPPDYGTAFIRYSPIGVVLGGDPGDFPFYQVVRFAAPNLMIGNTVLIRHATTIPPWASALDDVVNEAGAPTGIYTNLLISEKQASTLTIDKRIKGIYRTGSGETKAFLGHESGKNLKKPVLEESESTVFIILDDADVGKVIEWAIAGRISTRKGCVMVNRLIAVESVAAALLKKIREKRSRISVDSPMDRTSELAIPTKEEELMGSEIAFYKVSNEQAAIDLANESLGMETTLFTQDIERGLRVANQIHSGTVFINYPTWAQADLPFGEVNRSDYGQALAELGIDGFVNQKLIRVCDQIDPFLKRK